MSELLLVLVAFAVMEPVAYLLHRFVMHERGMVWHRSHHQPRPPGEAWERNDLFPVVLASITMTAMMIGALVASLGWLLWTGVGVTGYGMAYLFVHDIYIHRRIKSFTWTWGPLERVREAHRIHHLFSGEPYGFLFPIVPAELRARAATTERDPLLQPSSG